MSSIEQNLVMFFQVKGEKEVENGIKNITKEQEKLENNLEKSSKSIKNYASQVKDWLDKNQSTFEKMGNRGTKWFAIIGGGAMTMAQLHAETERTRITFDTLAKSIGGTASDALETMRTATRGLVNDTALMESANQYISMGLASNTEEMGKLSEMATKLGSAMGNSATQSMADFAALLANQSLPRLDTFGISSGKVRERIEELMNATAGMTREEAFMTAVMEEGTKSMERLGVQSDTAGEKMQKMNTMLYNAKVNIGEALVPVMLQLLELITPIIKSFAEWTQEHPKLIKNLILVSVGITGVVGLIGNLLVWINKAIVAFGTFSKVLKSINPLLLAFGTAITIGKILEETTEGVGEAQYYLNKEFEELNRQLESGEISMEAYSQSLADLLPRQEAINERMKEMNNFSASGFWETLKSDFGDTMWRIFSIDGLVEQFKDFGVLGDALQNWMDTQVIPFLVDGAGRMIDALGIAFNGIGDMFDSRADTFFGGIEDLQNKIFQSLDNFAIRIKDLWDIGLTWISERWNTARTGISDFFIYWRETITTTFNEIRTTFQNIITIGLTTINTGWTTIWNTISTFTKNVRESIKSTFSTAIGFISDFFNGGAKEMLSNAWDGVMNAIGAVTKNVANGILTTVENMVNRAIDMINRMIEAVNSVSGTIGISFDLIKPIDIPKFKDGGIVGGLAGIDNILARVSPGELILNRSQQENLAGQLQGSGGSNIYITFAPTIYGDSEEYAQKIGDMIVSELKNHTRTESY